MAKQNLQIPVRVRSVVARIQRALARRGQKLLIGRGIALRKMGRYVIVTDTKVEKADVDLLELARELKVIAPYETICG